MDRTESHRTEFLSWKGNTLPASASKNISKACMQLQVRRWTVLILWEKKKVKKKKYLRIKYFLTGGDYGLRKKKENGK